jgi:predicted nucleic acid-binding protein
MADVVVLDAGTLIALYDSRDAHHEWAVDLFVSTARFTLAMSALTYAEVMVHPARAGRLGDFVTGVSGLQLDIRPVEAGDAEAIAQLRDTTGLKMPDVCLLHCALPSSAILATTDSELARVARDLGITVTLPGS